MTGEKGRIVLGKTLALLEKSNFRQIPIRINGKKDPKGKTIATVKIQVNPTLKRSPSRHGWEWGWRWGPRIKTKFRSERRFYEDTCSGSHKTMKQHVFNKHERKVYSGRPCGHRAGSNGHFHHPFYFERQKGKFMIWISSESVVTEVMF